MRRAATCAGVCESRDAVGGDCDDGVVVAVAETVDESLDALDRRERRGLVDEQRTQNGHLNHHQQPRTDHSPVGQRRSSSNERS